MPNAFEISSPTSTVNGRKGQATFTVTNATGRPVRVRASVTGADPIKPEWFTITPAVEQDCVIGGTLQYTVDVTVPADVPPGTYAVKFATAAEDRPEEDYSDLAWSIVVEDEATNTGGKFPWWILLVVLGVVLIGVVLYFLLRSDPDPAPPSPTTTTELTTTTSGRIVVPSVSRQKPETAAKTIFDLGLRPVVVSGTSQAPAANQFPCVVATFPTAGSEVDRGTEVGMLVGLCSTIGTKPPLGDREIVLCSRFREACVDNRFREPFRRDIEEDAQIRP